MVLFPSDGSVFGLIVAFAKLLIVVLCAQVHHTTIKVGRQVPHFHTRRFEPLPVFKLLIEGQADKKKGALSFLLSFSFHSHLRCSFVVGCLLHR